MHFDPANKAFFESLTNFKPLMNERFLEGIKHIVPSVPVFEEFLTHVRRHLLLHPHFFDARTTLANAMAQFAFNTGYILDVTDEETEQLQHLGTSDEDLAIFSCYKPLHERGITPDDLGTRPAIKELIRTQVEAPNRLKNTPIISLTAIDTQSTAVQEMYESFPYPTWKTISPELEAKRWHQAKRNQEMEGHLADRKIKILIAGCGTGEEAISFAAIFPRAEVLAIDLSRNSLAYAIQKAQECGIENIQFRHADILKLEHFPERFDYIVSSGVLHHMVDPFLGWGILRGLLAANGLMKIALYSRLAHRHILKAQAVAKAHGYTDIKVFRKASPMLLDPETRQSLFMLGDCYHLNMYKDMLFHVQDHVFSIQDIAAMLQTLKLKFNGFQLNTTVNENYSKQYRYDLNQTDLDNWNDFEIKNPDTFRSMYMFWCQASS